MNGGPHTNRPVKISAPDRASRLLPQVVGLMLLTACTLGCRTSFREYVSNGFKVGPNYCTPAAPVSEQWIDYYDNRLAGDGQPPWDWWRVFGDPHLETLVQRAHQQNLTLREAGFRIQEARARRAITAGNLFPQQQTAYGSYQRQQLSLASGVQAGGGGGFPGVERNFDIWRTGGQFAWELDFWGRFRRAIEAADAELDASVENFDDVLVILLGDVAATYVEVRTLEQRIRYARSNVKFQTGSVELAKIREEEGAATRLDIAQAVTNVAQTEAAIPLLETQLRQAKNRLCVLMGLPPQDLGELLDGEVAIPRAPAQVAIGVPADLLRRRPDIRQAERLVAAQSARVGIRETDLYPAFSITGNIFVQATELKNLFTPEAVGGSVGPGFNWNILNYGRIQHAIDAEEAIFMQRVTQYQNTVLNANREVEDAIVGFLRAQEQARVLRIGVDAAVESRDLTQELYRGGRADFGRVFFAEYFLVLQQDALAQSEGAIAANLVEIYRALGGGWQTRLSENQGTALVPLPPTAPVEEIPRPAAEPVENAPPQLPQE
jgi:NodT family efflux transporter outer membrane factor (OMF) lipoprotein